MYEVVNYHSWIWLLKVMHSWFIRKFYMAVFHIERSPLICTSHSFYVVGLLFSCSISVCLHMQLFMNLNFNSFTHSPMCRRIRYTTSRLQGSVQCRTCSKCIACFLSHLYARLAGTPQQQYYYTWGNRNFMRIHMWLFCINIHNLCIYYIERAGLLFGAYVLL